MVVEIPQSESLHLQPCLQDPGWEGSVRTQGSSAYRTWVGGVTCGCPGPPGARGQGSREVVRSLAQGLGVSGPVGPRRENGDSGPPLGL